MDIEVDSISVPVIANTAPFTAGLSVAQAEAAVFEAKARAGFAGVTGGINNTTGAVGGLGGALGKLGPLMIGAFGGMLVIGQIEKTITAASDLNEAINMTGLVFGKNKQEVVEWSKTSAEAFGLSSTEALQAAASYANLFSNVGMSMDVSQAYSQQLVSLSSDMASAFNTSVPDAIQAISAGLRGEAEPLRRYGIMLDDVTLKNKALSMGIYEGTGMLDQNAKAQAAYAIILEKSAKFQGDFQNTSDDPANAARILQAQIENLRASIAQDFLPIWKEFLNGLKDVMKWAKDNEAAIAGFIKMAAVIGGVAIAWKGISTAIDLAAVAKARWNLIPDKGLAGMGALGTVATGAALTAGAFGVGSQLANWDVMSAHGQQTTDSLGVVGKAMPLLGNQVSSVQQFTSGVLGIGSMFGMDGPQKAYDEWTGLAATRKEQEAKATELSVQAFVDGADARMKNKAALEGNTYATDQNNKAIATKTKLTEDDIAKQKEYQAAISSRQQGIMSSNPLLGDVVGEQARQSAEKGITAAEEQLRQAQENLAKVQGEYRNGSQQVKDATKQVTDAQAGLVEARKASDLAVNGLSLAEIQRRETANLAYRKQMSADMEALKKADVSEQAQLELYNLEQVNPGTIHNLVGKLTPEVVKGLNAGFKKDFTFSRLIAEDLEAAQLEVNKLYEAAGEMGRRAYERGWNKKHGVSSIGSWGGVTPEMAGVGDWRVEARRRMLERKENATRPDPSSGTGAGSGGGGGGGWGTTINIESQTVVTNDPNDYKNKINAMVRADRLVGK